MVSGPSKSQPGETVIADAHPAPVHHSNTQVFFFLFFNLVVQGPVVQNPIKANPRLKDNRGFQRAR